MSTQSRKMAEELVFMWRTYVDYNMENPRTKNTTVARAQFNGACHLAFAIGYGLTAANVSAVVRNTLIGNNVNDWFKPELLDELAERLESIRNCEVKR